MMRRRAPAVRYHCLNCKADTWPLGEYYALVNEVWLIVNPKDDGMLCIGCAEARLGRTLAAADFNKAALINDPAYRTASTWMPPMSTRLLSRIVGSSAGGMP